MPWLFRASSKISMNCRHFRLANALSTFSTCQRIVDNSRRQSNLTRRSLFLIFIYDYSLFRSKRANILYFWKFWNFEKIKVTISFGYVAPMKNLYRFSLKSNFCKGWTKFHALILQISNHVGYRKSDTNNCTVRFFLSSFVLEF